MTPEEMEELDIIEFADEDGNTLLLQVDRYFFYLGNEYALMYEYGAEETEDPASYILQVTSYTDENGEDMEEFVLPDESLLETLLTVARTQFTPDAE